MTQDLPIVTIPYRFARNPEWKPGDPHSAYYLKNHTVRAEVITLHLNARTMRVRVMDGDKPGKDCTEADIIYFYNSFNITPVQTNATDETDT